MFTDLSWSHMLLVLVVALVVVGPKDLPKLMRTLGQWTAKARDMADQFRRSFDDMARQSELDELRKELQELRETRPFAKTQDEITAAMGGPTVSISPQEPAAAEAGVEGESAVQTETAEHGQSAEHAEIADHSEPAETVEPPEPMPSGHKPPAP